MAIEPEETEKLNAIGRTAEEKAERELAEALAAKIEAVTKDQPHKAAMDALGYVLRGMSENDPGPVLPTAQPESGLPQDQTEDRSRRLLQIGSVDLDVLAADQFAQELASRGIPYVRNVRKPRSEEELRAEEEGELQYRFKLAVQQALAEGMDADGIAEGVWDVLRAGQYIKGKWPRRS